MIWCILFFAFDIEPDIDLDIMRPQQTLTAITTDVLTRMGKCWSKNRTDNRLLVHGDTTTSFACSGTAFIRKYQSAMWKPVFLTYDRYSPFPEEMNRNLTGKTGTASFAPTGENKKNLEAEGIRGQFISLGILLLMLLRQHYVIIMFS